LSPSRWCPGQPRRDQRLMHSFVWYFFDCKARLAVQAASSYFSTRLDTAQGTGRFGWLHYFRSPSLPYDGRPETSRRIQAEPNIPANLPASLVLTRSSDCLRSAMRLILFTAIRASIGAENLIPEEVNYTKITVRVAVMNKVQFLLASEPCKPLEPRSL
jgi:hypothetical protein